MATDASGAVLALGTAAGRVSIWRCSDLTLLFGSDKLAAAGLPRDSEVKCVAFGGRRAGALELAASFDSGEAHCAALRVAAEGESVAEPSVVDCKVTREAGTLRKPPGCENAALKHCRCARCAAQVLALALCVVTMRRDRTLQWTHLCKPACSELHAMHGMHLQQSTYRGCSVCRFARCSDDSDALVCTLNYKGSGWVARWAQQPDGSYAFGRKSRAFPNALTSMQTGSTPTRVAIGSSDGEVYILDAESLAVMQQDRKAHMVFATAVAVAADGHAAVSTSGDASARVTELAGGGGSGMCGTFTCVMLLLALAVAVWLAAQHREDLMLLTQSGREMVEKRVLETEAAELERPVEL